MQATGLLITTWPIVLGCDASGTVIKTGSSSSSSSFSKTTTPKFNPGDRVCGCTRVGVPGYSTFQEYFLMDADLTISVPPEGGLSFHEAATIGVGAETACLGLFQGLGLEMTATTTPKNIWVVVFGGAGSVGQYSIQIVKAFGYKVVTTCSQRSIEFVKSLGADAVVDYSALNEDEQFEEIRQITDGGQFFGVWDTVNKSEKLGRRLLSEVSKFEKSEKVYATTDDWTPMDEYEDHRTYRVELGLLGRSEDEVKATKASGLSVDMSLNKAMAEYVQIIPKLIKDGKLRPNPFEVVDGGFDAVEKAVELQNKGTKEKVVLQFAEP